jgi:hypothetical protein
MLAREEAGAGKGLETFVSNDFPRRLWWDYAFLDGYVSSLMALLYISFYLLCSILFPFVMVSTAWVGL